MGRDVGLLVCTQCRATVRTDGAAGAVCPRCGARIHARKPHSLVTTAGLIITATLLYIPANLLPVMHTHSFFDDDDNTIMSGVISLADDGSLPLAALVFVASIVVPLLKLVTMTLLIVTVRRGSRRSPLQATRLYRLVELIGRWSMLDVYVVTLLVGLVQIQSLAIIEPGAGVFAFGAVVVFTMLSALSFDPRLIWDPLEDGHGHGR